MLELPKSTEYGKRIPKQKFYEHMAISPQLKRIFVEQVKAIQWRHKLATSTFNVGVGQEVTEIEVFEITLTRPQLDEALLRHISCPMRGNTKYGRPIKSWPKGVRRNLRCRLIIIRIGWQKRISPCVLWGWT